MSDVRLVKVEKYLQNWESVKAAVEKSHNIDELKVIKDKAEALRTYAKQAKESLQVQNNISEIKLRAERRIGEISRDLPKAPGSKKTVKATSEHDASRLSKTEALKEIGIEKTAARRYEAIASLPEPVFEKHIKDTKNNYKELTTVGMVRLAMEHKRNGKKQTSENKENLPVDKQYATLYVAPYWRSPKSQDSGDKNPTLKQIKALPITDISKSDSVLFIMTWSKNLAKSLELIKAWGFTYQTCAVRIFKKPGHDDYFNHQHGLLLIATKGVPPLPLETNRPSFILENKSTKPGFICSIIERMYPELQPRVKLFAEEKRDGWDIWGNQETTAESEDEGA